MTNRTGHLAFTLVEMIVVMVIIGVLATMAAPRYANHLAHQRVEAAARQVVADLQRAQRKAKFSSSSQTVTFDLVKDSYRLKYMTDPDKSGAPYEIFLGEDPYRAVITGADFSGGKSVTYNAFGVPDTGGTVTVQVGTYRKTITVAADNGKVTEILDTVQAVAVK